jgi:hypothetical protein
MHNFDDIMKELRATYLEETRQRTAAMTLVIERLERNPGAAQSLAELVMQFHGLAGSGASYGFAELSLLGRLGEFDSGVRLRQGGVCTPEDIRTWRTLVAQIEATACGSAGHIGHFALGVVPDLPPSDFAAHPRAGAAVHAESAGRAHRGASAGRPEKDSPATHLGGGHCGHNGQDLFTERSVRLQV